MVIEIKIPVSVRLKPSEILLLKENAAALGLRPSEYYRMLILKDLEDKNNV